MQKCDPFNIFYIVWCCTLYKFIVFLNCSLSYYFFCTNVSNRIRNFCPSAWNKCKINYRYVKTSQFYDVRPQQIVMQSRESTKQAGCEMDKHAAMCTFEVCGGLKAQRCCRSDTSFNIITHHLWSDTLREEVKQRGGSQRRKNWKDKADPESEDSSKHETVVHKWTHKHRNTLMRISDLIWE